MTFFWHKPLTQFRNLWSTKRRDVGSKAYNDLLNELRYTERRLESHQKNFLVWLDDAEASTDRQSSRIEALERRIERATACVTPGANATVRKMAAILRGDA